MEKGYQTNTALNFYGKIKPDIYRII